MKYLFRYLYPLALCYWFLFRPKTFGTKCLLVCEGKVLLIQHTYGPQGWNLPGGGIEEDETPEETTIREMREELGVTLESIQKLGEYVRTAEYKIDTVYCFWSTVTSFDVTLQEQEILHAQWFTIDEIPKNLAFGARKPLELYALLEGSTAK